MALLLLLSFLLSSSSALPANRGHLEPLFLTNPASPVPIHNGYPDPTSFVANNFEGDAPLYMQQCFQLYNWTDEALARKLTGIEATAEERRKQTDDVNSLRLDFAAFLKGYRKQQWHLNMRLPPPLARETLLPYPLQCPGLDGAFSDLFMAMAGGETKSRLRFDTDSQFYCQERGVTHVALVNTSAVKDFLDDIVDIPDISASSVDVDRVDLKKFPKLRNIHVLKADVTAGDCIFIPEFWLYYLRTGPKPYVAFAIYLNKLSTRGSLKRVAKSCRKSPDSDLTLAKVRFQFDEDRTGAAYGDGTPAWKVHGRREDGRRSLADVVMETLAELLLAELSWERDLPSVNKNYFVAKLTGKQKVSAAILDLATKLFNIADVTGDGLFDRFDVDKKLTTKRADVLEKLAEAWSAKTARTGLPDLTRPLHEQDKREVFRHRDEL